MKRMEVITSHLVCGVADVEKHSTEVNRVCDRYDDSDIKDVVVIQRGNWIATVILFTRSVMDDGL